MYQLYLHVSFFEAKVISLLYQEEEKVNKDTFSPGSAQIRGLVQAVNSFVLQKVQKSRS